MAITQYKRLLRVKIEGTVVKAREIRVTESLDSLTTVAEFIMAGRPTSAPAEGDAVLIDWINPTAGRAWRLFSGTISSSDRETRPWSFRIRATDQLSKFRRARTTTDLTLTGLTDGEAWMAIADACGITYDSADIADTGYVLGSLEPVFWPADHRTPASQVIQELDEVFGMATLQIGDGEGTKVVRIAVDYAPETTTGLYRTYTNGVSVEFSGHRRARGDVDQIQNVWSVTGVNHEEENGCTLTPWAKAEDGNELLGSMRVRVAEQSYSSDFIQSTPLAEAIVRRLMRRTNRVPDIHGAVMFNDPNVHPGSKVRLVDPTYGLNTGSSGRLFVVRSVDRSNFTMTLDLEGGPGGDEGTVTSGVERICNDTEGTGTAPDGFTPVDPGFPPIDSGWDDPFEGDDDLDDDGVPDSEQPLLGCTLDTTLDGSGDDTEQTTLGGSPDPNACPGVGLFGSDWYNRQFDRSAGGGLAHCEIHTPWYTPGSTLFRLTPEGSLTAVGQLSGISRIYASTETDPDLQDETNLLEVGTPLAGSISGTVTFNQPGSRIDIQWFNFDLSSGLLTASGATASIHSEPGVEVAHPLDGTHTYGVILTTDFQGPSKIGDSQKNESINGANSDNGGYVTSTPAALGVPVSFSFSIDESHKDGWGAHYASTDLGSGHIEHNDYITPGAPVPGEPLTPPSTCVAEHASHVLTIQLVAGAAGTYDEMAVILENLVLGHSTCAVNPSYVPPGSGGEGS